MGAGVPVLKDAAIQGEGYFAGANKPDAHLIGVAPGRDFPFEELDIRSVEAGDLAPGGHPIEIEPAIEVGQIFKLGTRYSEPLGANYLDEQGSEHPIVMGSYGIGPARTVAAAIEQGADERGIVWPRSIAPWDVHLVGLGKGGDEVSEAAERLHEELRGRGHRGRLRRPRRRAGGEAHGRGAARVPAADHRRSQGRSPRERSRRRRVAAVPRSACRSPEAAAACARAARWPRLSDRAGAGGDGTRRLFGLDRSGPKPRETRRGQPLRPLTIPNLVGYVRLGGDPRLPLPGASAPTMGERAAASILFLAISAADYLDGFLARATGQYSRMGALLDPVVDRLTVLAGIVVTWKFELLPRWALAVLAVREVVTLVLAQLALRRGVDLEINWVGRWSVWLTMGGIFLALATDAWIGPAMFLVGLVGLAPRLRALPEDRPVASSLGLGTIGGRPADVLHCKRSTST